MVHFLIVGLFTLASTYGLFIILTGPNVLPMQASAQAIPIDEMFKWDFLAVAFFYSLIVVFIIYSLIVFRRKDGDDDNEYGEYFEGNSKLEIIWVLIPLGVVILFAYLGTQSLGEVLRRDPGALEVDVIAQQWAWRFEYPETGTTSNELVLPENRQVLLRLHSEDVIHSFWVPEFRVKQDILPGGEEFIRELRVTPTVIGTYKIRCAELCGQLHYDMLANVVVLSKADFSFWLIEQSGECSEEAAICGEKLATQFACLACHSLDGATIVGPTWLGLADSTVPLEDGTTTIADASYLMDSILNPNAQIHEGFLANIMPQTFAEQLNDEQITQIVAFIESLK
ncbi:MAG: cytochrome c oxidase subunit II [Chloroflexota bacterium]